MTTMEERLKKIKAFVFDVDGVLTDGGVMATAEGDLYRTFNSKDGFGFRMASMHGYHLGIITGGRSQSIPKRFRTCGVKPEDIYLGARDKIRDLDDFCQRHSLDRSEVMYFGDDLPDIPVMKACGCGVCPSDAVDEVLEIADIVASRPGGRACARECMERVMRLQGTWFLDVDDYHAKF